MSMIAWTPTLHLDYVVALGALGMALLTSALAAAVPARTAMRLSPAEALRYE
jgi:ABC-type lipoprotein release transport system permease subunit